LEETLSSNKVNQLLMNRMSNPYTDELVFEALQTPDEKEYAAVLSIYKNSFPKNERHPEGVIRERIEKGSNQLMVGKTNGQIIFMALLWPLNDTPFILLDYMATDPKYRNKKIGTRFLAHMKPVLKASNRYFILEAENPATGLNREERAQRVNFYRSNGAKQLMGVQFLLPALQEGSTTEMILMIFPGWPGNFISSEIVAELIRRIYKELYNVNEADALANSSGYLNKTTIALY